MIECIHGLDEALCDICTPRQKPEAQELAAPPTRTATPRVRAPRTPAAPRSTSLRSSAAARTQAPAALPDIDLASMRVHHWTHLSNLAGIIADGALRAGATPELDVASPLTRERRAAASAPSGTPVSEHVPFALSPDASSWDAVRRGAEGVEWSDDARSTRPTDFVVLVAPVSALPDAFVFADGDGAAPITRFATGLDESAPLARRAALSDPELHAAEILVPESFDLASVTLIGVPHDRARSEVKALLRDYRGTAPRVAVYPPWFRPSEA